MSPAISPVAPSPTLPLSSRHPSVSFGGFGLRDSRWDDREGLLFQGLYYRMDDNFGYMSPINGQGGITLSNFLIKTLLPMVGDEAHNANIPQGQRMYYLEDPSREPYEGSQFTVVSEELKRTISLAEIKVKIAALAGP